VHPGIACAILMIVFGEGTHGPRRRSHNEIVLLYPNPRRVARSSCVSPARSRASRKFNPNEVATGRVKVAALTIDEFISLRGTVWMSAVCIFDT
jgi:hypothetical protein